jgi:hypothetical protein
MFRVTGGFSDASIAGFGFSSFVRSMGCNFKDYGV